MDEWLTCVLRGMLAWQCFLLSVPVRWTLASLVVAEQESRESGLKEANNGLVAPVKEEASDTHQDPFQVTNELLF